MLFPRLGHGDAAPGQSEAAQQPLRVRCQAGQGGGGIPAERRVRHGHDQQLFGREKPVRVAPHIHLGHGIGGDGDTPRFDMAEQSDAERVPAEPPFRREGAEQGLAAKPCGGRDVLDPHIQPRIIGEGQFGEAGVTRRGDRPMAAGRDLQELGGEAMRGRDLMPPLRVQAGRVDDREAGVIPEHAERHPGDAGWPLHPGGRLAPQDGGDGGAEVLKGGSERRRHPFGAAGMPEQDRIEQRASPIRPRRIMAMSRQQGGQGDTPLAERPGGTRQAGLPHGEGSCVQRRWIGFRFQRGEGFGVALRGEGFIGPLLEGLGVQD